MKIRMGFVSNSSSSSFILPIKRDDEDTFIKISIDDLKEAFKDSDESSVDKILSTVKELEHYFMEDYGFDELLESESYLKEKFEEYKNILKMGNSIMVGRIDQNESMLERIIKKMGGTIEH